MSRNSVLIFVAATALALGALSFYGADETMAGDKSEIELAAVCVDDLCGYVNSKGEWHIPPKFRAADPFSKDGLAWVITWDGVTDGSKYTGIVKKVSEGGLYIPQTLSRDRTCATTPYGGRFALIDTQGDFVVLWPVFDLIGPFSTGDLAAAEKHDKWGFINTSGQWIIEPKFERVGRFAANGLANVMADGNWGYINEVEQWVIEPRFDFATSFGEDGLALASTREKSADWIDAQGRKAGPRVSQSPQNITLNDLTPTRLNDAWGYTDQEGHWVIKPEFDHAGKFATNGLAAVSVGGNWGYINTKGEWTIELQFKRAGDFSANGLAAAKMSTKYGFIDSKGQWAIEPRFDNFWAFSDNGLAKVIVKGGRGIINTSGQWIVEPKFHDVSWPGKLQGNLVEAFSPTPWPDIYSMTCFVDINGGVYRTGLNEKIEEPGFRWEFVDNGKVLFNRQKEKVLTIEKVCGTEVAKNASGEISWPPNDFGDICQAGKN